MAEDPVSAVTRAAVLGGGTMGVGICQVLATAGIHTRLVSSTPSRTRASLERLARRTEAHVRDGLRSDKIPRQVADHVEAADGVANAVAAAQVVFEAVPEQPDLKRVVLAEASGAMTASGILATNTSSLPIRSLAEAVARPDRFLGVHWFNPPEWIPGIEVIPGPRTAPMVLRDVELLLRRLGKTPVRVGDSAGFVANRLQYALFTEALRCVEEGVARAEEIDEIVRSSFGFRLPFYGPLEIADMAGLDVYMAVYDVLERALGPRFQRPEILIEAVEAGRLGTKTGRGLREYDAGQIEEMLTRRDRLYKALEDLLRTERLDPKPTDNR
jgi:3-hydroxybutyryl-CoA dehydrogenase